MEPICSNLSKSSKNSEPASLNLFIFVILGFSTTPLFKYFSKSLLGTINLDEDNVFDIEYVDLALGMADPLGNSHKRNTRLQLMADYEKIPFIMVARN